MTKRSRKIKKVLEKIFGIKKVLVYDESFSNIPASWVIIHIYSSKPHSEPCNTYLCEACCLKRESIRNQVWQILKNYNLDKEFDYYYNHWNEKCPKCAIKVSLS